MKNETLTDILHDKFLSCGEILPAADIARIICEHEFDLEVELDAQTVLASVREAGERFVDSMVQNEHDTEEAVADGLYCGFPIDPLEARVAKWENMRPSGNTMNHTPHNMTHDIQLLASRPIRHRAATCGEVITRTDFIQTPTGLVAVDYWSQFETGKLIRVDAPRPVRPGEF